MNSVLTTIYEFFLAMGRAKAATALARMGDYEAARHIMLEK